MESNWTPTNAEEYKRWWAENTDVPYGYCWCGCGEQTPLAKGTDRPILRFKGEPIRYISYHRNSMDKKTFKTGTSNQLCACGCGHFTQYAKVKTRSVNKGEPLEFIKGHERKGMSPRNKLTDSELKKRWDAYRKWWEETYPDIPFGTCICGCGQETGIAESSVASAGYVKGCPRLYAVGHVGRKRIRGFEGYRVEDRGYETPCWIWQLGKDKDGYGILTTRDSEGNRVGSDRAHRKFYEYKYGEISEGLVLDHLCRITSCCNPDHVEPVKQPENVRRGNWAKLKIADVKEIKRLLRDTNLSYRAIAEMFDTGGANIGCIKRGENWKDVEI